MLLCQGREGNAIKRQPIGGVAQMAVQGEGRNRGAVHGGTNQGLAVEVVAEGGLALVFALVLVLAFAPVPVLGKVSGPF